MSKLLHEKETMGFQYWFVVCAFFLIGPLAFAQSIIFICRGVYTKTFKGTSRKEYIRKDLKPIEYWCSVIAQMIVSLALIALGFWFLGDIPTVNQWYSEVSALISFDY